MSDIKDILISNLIEGGRALMHSLKPDEFEYYACSFELLNSQHETEEIFHFPLMPTGMSVNSQYLVNIKKSSKGYLSQISDSFVGKNISISGSFGRKFRLFLHVQQKEGAPDTAPTTHVDLKLRTGYGATKLMEKIIEKNFQPDEYGNPRLLVFHNYAYNMSTIVEVLSYQPTMSMENNMMWNYAIEMKGLADYAATFSFKNDKSDLAILLLSNLAQKSINNLIKNVTPGSVLNAIKL